MLTVTIMIPPSELAQNGRVNRFAKARMAGESKKAAWALTAQLMKPLGIFKGTWRGPVEVQYTFHFRTTRTRDDDGAISRMKWARDGIALALGLDDTFFRVHPVIWGDRRDGTVDVTLTPATVVLPVRGAIG